MKEVYVQTASFSRELTADFTGSLEKIAAAGYTGLELFNRIHGGHETGKSLEAYLKSLGMGIIGSHIQLEWLDEQIAYFDGTECRYLICPGLHIGSRDEALKAAEQLNECGKKSKAAGMMIGYHNHNNDFDKYGDKCVIDLLIENTDPELVTFELDSAWAWRAGVNAAEFIKRYNGRFQLIHVKETTRALTAEDNMFRPGAFANLPKDKDGRPIFPEEMRKKMEERRKINCKMGDGIINIPDLKATADAQGCQAYVVEREYAYTGDIFTSLAEDCAHLKTI